MFLIQASNMMPLARRNSRKHKNNLDNRSGNSGSSSGGGGENPRCWPFHLSSTFSLPFSGRFISPLALAESSYTSDTEPTFYIDAPFWVHWPKLSLWILMEAFLIAVSIDLGRNPPGIAVVPSSPPEAGSSCKTYEYETNFTSASHVLSNLVAAMAIVYLLVYAITIIYCFRIYYALPYTKFRMGNLVLRLHVRLRGLSFGFFIATIIVYFYVKQGGLASYILGWYGLLPMQLVNTVLVIAQAYLLSPKKPEQTAILQVWLQEFAWTEADLPRQHQERVSSLPHDSFEGFCMDCEPLFCFETAVKLMYWSFLAYDTGELPNSPFNSATALGLYNLDHFDCVWEKALNTKAVIGWTDDPSCATIVIAFRGTASASNFLADLQVWRARYPPDIGTPLLGTAPLVHKGFLKTYTKNGFHDRLLAKVEHILNRCQDSVDTAAENAAAAAENANHNDNHTSTNSNAADGHTPITTSPAYKPPIKVIITGHSLGGALAVLCSHDIATRTPCAAYDIDISCYTFGAPRVGNHAWAREYNSKISETWQLINSDDVVTRAGKFFFLFKHVGHRVLLNRRGDLVVRPSFVEYSIRRSPGGSVKDHYLTSYERAVVAVLAAQFGRKSFSLGAKEGARALAHSAGAKKLLDRAGLSLKDVQRLEEGRAQLTRQHSEQLKEKGEEEKEEEEARRRIGEQEGGTGYWLKPQIRQWWDVFAGLCLGRHELEPIVAREREERSPPPPTIYETETTAAEGEVGAVAEAGDQMEARQRAETGLLHCREMCSNMGAASQRQKRSMCGSGRGGRGRGEGSGSGSHRT